MKKMRYRKSIEELLSSIEELDPMVGPVEMACGWFDDLYFPADPDIDQQGEAFAEWRSCFTDSQLQALEHFHRFFKSVSDDLSEDPRRFAEDPKWQELSNLAKEIRPVFGDKD